MDARRSPPADAATPGADAVDPARQAITAMRDRGEHRVDPLRYGYIDALARRADRHAGDVRRRLDRELARALADYRERVAMSRSPGADVLSAPAPTPPPAPAPGPLGELVRRLDGRRSVAPQQQHPLHRAANAAAPDLAALRDTLATWVRLSVDRQLSRSLQQAPANPGPLNTHGLVLRSLQLMQQISPDYLDRIVEQIETLSWLDAAATAAAPVPGQRIRRDGSQPRRRGRVGERCP